MNREVKFRGKYRNVWVVGDLVQYGIYKSIRAFGANPLEKPTEYMVVPESVGEFTGLKDKNGKEIFEGDIVNMKTNYHVSEKPFGWQNVEIIFFDLAFKARNKSNHHYDLIEETDEGPYNWDIRGNIFENPELLT